MILVWTEQAAARLRSQAEALALENVSAADTFVRRVQDASAVLRIFPFAGAKLKAGLRKYVVPQTRLVLIYSVVGATVEIRACFDGREDWRSSYPLAVG